MPCPHPLRTRHPWRVRKRWDAVPITLLVAMVGTFAGAPAAQATLYRYWSYWWAQGSTWTFASAGPASSLPEDGSVQGWRFGVTGIVGGTKDAPSVDPSDAFERACSATPVQQGRKRVALVIDPGPVAQAPAPDVPGPVVLACASAPASANGYQVLRSIAQVRTQHGLVCAIGGYPSVGCADPVDADPVDADPAAVATAGPESAASSDGPGPLPLVIAGLAIGAMVGFIWRRRRSP